MTVARKTSCSVKQNNTEKEKQKLKEHRTYDVEVVKLLQDAVRRLLGARKLQQTKKVKVEVIRLI